MDALGAFGLGMFIGAGIIVSILVVLRVIGVLEVGE